MTKLKEMAECPVCYNTTSSYVKPCMHSLCSRCSRMWLSKIPKCPVCRGIVYDTHPRLKNDDVRRRIRIRNYPLGLTLSNVDDIVIVQSVNRKDYAYAAGIRRGVELQYINGIPVSSHASAMEILNRLEKDQVSVTFHIITFRTFCGFIL